MVKITYCYWEAVRAKKYIGQIDKPNSFDVTKQYLIGTLSFYKEHYFALKLNNISGYYESKGYYKKLNNQISQYKLQLSKVAE